MGSQVVVVQVPRHRTGCLGIIGNILWLLIAGWELALGYLFAALIMAITIIGIPFAVQAVKLAGYSLWPFGKYVYEDPEAADRRGLSAVANVLWLVLVGWWLALAHVIAGVVLCLTIIGIPFGVQCFKMAGLALFPFGKTVA